MDITNTAATNSLTDRLRAHFALGGRVRVTTYLSQTIFGQGCTVQADGSGVWMKAPRRRPVYLTERDVEFGQLLGGR